MIRGYKENTIAGADNYFSSMDIHFGHFIASFGVDALQYPKDKHI